MNAEIAALKEGIIKQIALIRDDLRDEKIALDSETFKQHLSSDINTSPIKYDICVKACDGFVVQLESEIDKIIKDISAQIVSATQHLTSLRKACKEKEAADFNAAIKAYIDANPKISSAEARALAQGKISGWIKNSVIDWDMYFIHSYLVATKARPTDICRDNVVQHIYFPNLRESAKKIMTDFVKTTLTSEMVK